MDWSHPPAWFNHYALWTVGLGMAVQVIFLFRVLAWVAVALWEAVKKEYRHDPR